MIKEEFEKIIKEEGNDYEFTALGLPCLLMRNTSVGTWCGYVGVPKNSRLNSKRHYTSSNSENGISPLEKAIYDISVHGGLTYSGRRKKGDDTWYFGFDCAHSGDLMIYSLDTEGDTYKNKQFVIEECLNLARQLNEIMAQKL